MATGYDSYEDPGKESSITFRQTGSVVFDHYTIEGILGIGGMGIVYLATDHTFPNGGRPCALKETSLAEDDPPTMRQRMCKRALQIEADIMSKLQHPAIPRVLNYFSWQRHHYLVMDYIDGKTLNDCLKEQLKTHNAAFDEPLVIRWAMQICDLFDYLHHREPPVIHRDVKPENFILTPNHELRMIDFGIARRVVDQEHITELGTEGYAAPESREGYGDQRTDLFSLGVMIHALLTGIKPRNVGSTEWEQHRPRRYRATLSQGIDDIIMRCLKVDPRERFASARALRDALLPLMQSWHRAATNNGHAARSQESDVTASHVSDDMRPRPNQGAYHMVDPPMGGDLISRTGYTLAPEVVWMFEAQGAVRSSPTVQDDMVFFGAQDAHIYAVTLKEGTLTGSFAVNGNIVSDPVVTDRSVFFGAEDGVMYAINRALTRKQWSYSVGKPIVSTPTRFDDLIVIGANDGLVYGFPLTGTEPRWRFETWGAVRGSLSRINDLIVFGSCDQRVYAIDSEGQQKWHRTTRDKLLALPVMRRNIIYVGGLDQYLYALEAEMGHVIWKTRMEDCILTAVAVHEGRVFVGSSDGRITCLDAQTGDVKWRYFAGSQITSDLVLRDQRLYFACANGALYCFNIHTQQVHWRFQASGPIVTRPALTPEMVIVGCLDHRVYALYDKGITES
jgi:serine/threonine protein kinase/outer membrane protein assembly factor BamB